MVDMAEIKLKHSMKWLYVYTASFTLVANESKMSASFKTFVRFGIGVSRAAVTLMQDLLHQLGEE